MLSWNDVSNFFLVVSEMFSLVTFFWYHPPMQGDIPPPCRAHSATEVNGQILVFGGGNADKYYNHLYLLDTSEPFR